MSTSEKSPLVDSGESHLHIDGFDMARPRSSSWKTSIWKDRLVTSAVVASVLVVASTCLGANSKTANDAPATLVKPAPSRYSTDSETTIPTYRSECKRYSTKHRVDIIQTSLGAPSQQYSQVECLLPQRQGILGNAIVVDINAYGAPDAVLRVDLSTPAFPDRNVTILGFGGAFTEASALNYESLSKEGKETVMQLLYGKEGLGYALGRVHMNSCDFSIQSYSFDDMDGDFKLDNFDTHVSHDVDMIAMMSEATTLLQEAWGDTLNIYASPWSPPAWMKAPTPWDNDGAVHASGMSNSAQPTCLREGVGKGSRYAKSWALYFSKFLTAYADRGVKLFAVTIQNEPEFPAPWEACAYTEFTQSDFLMNHLGPELRLSHPDVKIFIFDHNKDHAPRWINHLLNESNPARQYVDGTAIHWYAGGMDRLLDGAQGNANFHRVLDDLDDLGVKNDHIVLGSESCHCPTTGYAGGDIGIAWARAERYAHTMLADLAAGSNGWVEWNIILDSIGGPNHLGNLCDAPLLAVPHRALGAENIPPTQWFEKHGNPSRFGRVIGDGRTREELNALGNPAKFLDAGVVVQPLYYYMGHISRHVRPGSTAVKGLVESSSVDRTFRRAGQLVAGGGINDLARTGIEVTVWPCEGSTRQQFKWNQETQLQVFGHDWLGIPTNSCVTKEINLDFQGLMLGACDITLEEAGEFALEPFNRSTGTVRMLLKNGKRRMCLVVAELKNQGGALGLRGGSQVALGGCNSSAAEWKVDAGTGEILSSYLGDDVCMTTGWPFLQMGAFDTPATPDADNVIVILNEANEAANYLLRDMDEVILTGSIPAHSIQTVSLT